jgi:hypothetical protein
LKRKEKTAKPFNSLCHQDQSSEAFTPAKATPLLQSSSRNPAPDRNRSRSRNHRSRSPKYAIVTDLLIACRAVAGKVEALGPIGANPTATA